MNVFIIVKRDAIAFTAVTTGTSRLLIIAFKTLRDVVVNHETHIRFVNTHSESYRSHNHVDFLHKELVLILTTCLAVETGMVRQCLDSVNLKSFSEFLNFFTAKCVNDSRFSRIVFDIFYNVFYNIFCLGSYLIIKIRTVERRLENLRIGNLEVFHDVVLHFHRGCCGKGDDRQFRIDGIDNRTQTAVLWTEVMTPFRDTMRLVDGEK